MDLGLDRFKGGFERFVKLPKVYRMVALPVLAGVIVGAYWHFFFVPARQELVALHAEHQKLQRKLNEVRSVAGNLPKFEEELENLQERLKAALRQLPDSKELPVLLTDISTLGKDAGLEFTAFRPQQETIRDFYAEVPIEIEFTGSFNDIAVFFDRIAKLPRIVNVNQLKLTILKTSSLETVLKAKGRATTFRFVEGGKKPNQKASLAPKERHVARGGGSA